MKKVLLLFSALFILTGCTTLKTALLIPEKVEVFKPYTTGEVLEKSVGDQMIGYNLFLTAKAFPGFIAIEDYNPPAFSFGQTLPPIKAGTEWKAIAKLADGGYLCINRDTKDRYRALVFSPSGPKQQLDWDICLLVNSANEPFGTATCDTWGPSASIWTQKPENFLQPKRIIEKKEDVWREAFIIYAGKTKDSIRFLYQETALKDLEFTFDLSESNTVSIKDITFEIIEATNNFIKYKIKTSPDELKSKIEKREKEKKLPEA